MNTKNIPIWAIRITAYIMSLMMLLSATNTNLLSIEKILCINTAVLFLIFGEIFYSINHKHIFESMRNKAIEESKK